MGPLEFIELLSLMLREVFRGEWFERMLARRLASRLGLLIQPETLRGLYEALKGRYAAIICLECGQPQVGRLSRCCRCRAKLSPAINALILGTSNRQDEAARLLEQVFSGLPPRRAAQEV